MKRIVRSEEGKAALALLAAVAVSLAVGCCLDAVRAAQVDKPSEAVAVRYQAEQMTVKQEIACAATPSAVQHVQEDAVEQMNNREDPDEAEKIEAALVERGYFREDVPLTYLEQDYLHTACEEFGVEYEVMLGLIERETNFRNVQGDGGDSIGYCQIQPKYWSELMEEIGAEDLNEPFDNFRTACAILSRHMENYGDLEAALTAYNAGHDTGSREYAAGVLENAEKWKEAEK